MENLLLQDFVFKIKENIEKMITKEETKEKAAVPL